MYDSARIIGGRQLEVALKLYQDATTSLHGPVRFSACRLRFNASRLA